jgi:hypothetical protein
VRLNVRFTNVADDKVGRDRIEVTDAATGEKLQGVRRVSFDADYRGRGILKLEIVGFTAEVEAPAEVERVEPTVESRGYADVTDMNSGFQEWRRPPAP